MSPTTNQGRPESRPASRKIGIQIGESERARLAALAHEQDRSFGAEVRRAIKWYLSEVERTAMTRATDTR